MFESLVFSEILNFYFFEFSIFVFFREKKNNLGMERVVYIFFIPFVFQNKKQFFYSLCFLKQKTILKNRKQTGPKVTQYLPTSHYHVLHAPGPPSICVTSVR